ncbi:MAG: hypothetical protein ACLFVI_03915 [Archaeoglobaceae archaeon]
MPSYIDKIMDFLGVLSKLVPPFLICFFGFIIVTIGYRTFLNTTITDILGFFTVLALFYVPILVTLVLSYKVFSSSK